MRPQMVRFTVTRMGFILLCFIFSLSGLCFAEGSNMEEITIKASMGELYGILTMPQTETEFFRNNK